MIPLPAVPPALSPRELSARVTLHFRTHKPEPTSFPVVATRVMDLAEHPKVDASQLAQLIQRDPAITTAVLAMANSAANRPAVPIDSVQQAVARLGLSQVANIAVGIASRSLFDMEIRVQQELFTAWFERLFHAAMTEALSCDALAVRLGLENPHGLFLYGLLNGLGRSLRLRSLASLVISGTVAVPSEADVEEVIGHQSAAVGALALETFNMPEDLVAVCRAQSDPEVRAEWTHAHVVRLIASLNALRSDALDTNGPIARLRSSSQSLQLSPTDTVEVAGLLCEHSAQVHELFSTSDDAEEAGYLEFVERCLEDS